ncbi:hypothetical protein [Bacillus sp. RC252]|uniref:hypothetical protein n=1 Tax=Bacillus sp. RC252 TaxID=3156289 RepID=UPI0038375510
MPVNSGINEKYRYSSWKEYWYFLCGSGKSTVFSLQHTGHFDECSDKNHKNRRIKQSVDTP